MKKEIKVFVELISAVVLGSIVFPLGLAHNIIKPFYDYRKRKVWDRITSSLCYYFNLIYQAWSVVRRTIHEIAKSLDIFGNAVAGELIEDLITHEEDTYFGNGGITLSAAIGHLEAEGKLNKLGLWLSKMLNLAFGEEKHAVWSYEREILNTHTEENSVK